MRRYIWLPLVSLMFMALSLPTFAQEKKPDGAPKRPPTSVTVDAVKTEPLRQTVPVIGRFVARQSGVVAARVAGPIDQYLVEVGDRVEKGDEIAILVTNAFVWERNRRAAEVARAKAELATKRASTEMIAIELKRLDGLKKSPAFSPARMDDKKQESVRAKSEASEASANLKAAEAALQLGEIALSNTVIRAPYAGVIVERHTEAGAYVREGDPIVTMLDHNNLEIEADVPANRIAGLTEGRELAARMETGTTLTATVRAVIPDENPRTRTRRVRFISEFEGEVMSSAANQTVMIDVPAGELKSVLTVHKDAILNRGNATIVVLEEDGKAAFRPVRLGQAVGQRFVVEDGLNEGDNVVIRGNERLRPGQSISGSSAPAKVDGQS